MYQLYLNVLWLSGCLAIWPAPREYDHGSTVVWLAQDFHVSYAGDFVCQVPFPCHIGGQKLTVQDQKAADASRVITMSELLIQGAIKRARKALFKQNIVPWKLIPRNTIEEFEPTPKQAKLHIHTLAITQLKPDSAKTFKPLAGQVDESYNLTIAVNGTAQIQAVSSTGVLRALDTFVQLFYQHSSGIGVYTKLAPVRISDAPRFSHRGLNLDVARNWYPVDDILRVIDALSWNKVNRLHIHMTDSQSWPLDIPTLPELSAKGSYQRGLSYSPADLEHIQRYGIERGVSIYIEFDMPGHTTAIGHSHPELITAYNAKPWTTYCAEPPCGSLKLNDSMVYTFLNKLFDDVLPRVNPYSAHFHTGGDEVNMNAYLLEETLRNNSATVLKPLIQKLVDFTHSKLRKAGLAPVVWEEMLLTWNLTLGPDVIVQTWLNSRSVQEVVARGHKALVGSYDVWYLDCGKGQWLNFDNGPSFRQWYPFNDYCSPVKNWRLAYSLDPLADIPTNRQHLILGGEAHMWSEQTDPVNLDDMLWPRLSAVGEVLCRYTARPSFQGQGDRIAMAKIEVNWTQAHDLQNGESGWSVGAFGQGQCKWYSAPKVTHQSVRFEQELLELRALFNE